MVTQLASDEPNRLLTPGEREAAAACRTWLQRAITQFSSGIPNHIVDKQGNKWIHAGSYFWHGVDAWDSEGLKSKPIENWTLIDFENIKELYFTYVLAQYLTGENFISGDHLNVVVDGAFPGDYWTGCRMVVKAWPEFANCIKGANYWFGECSSAVTRFQNQMAGTAGFADYVGSMIEYYTTDAVNNRPYYYIAYPTSTPQSLMAFSEEIGYLASVDSVDGDGHDATDGAGDGIKEKMKAFFDKEVRPFEANQVLHNVFASQNEPPELSLNRELAPEWLFNPNFSGSIIARLDEKPFLNSSSHNLAASVAVSESETFVGNQSTLLVQALATSIIFPATEPNLIAPQDQDDHKAILVNPTV